jgi:hypothetical protein
MTVGPPLARVRVAAARPDDRGLVLDRSACRHLAQHADAQVARIVALEHELAAAEARVKELDASADVLASVIRAGIRRVDALERAARAVVARVEAGTERRREGCWCLERSDPTDRHAADCPVGALAILLEGT